MPVNQVKTPEEEKLWNKAKAIAAKEGHKEDWAYINGIYQNMKGRDKKKGSLSDLLGKVAGNFVIPPHSSVNYDPRARVRGEGFVYPYNPNYTVDQLGLGLSSLLHGLSGGLYNPTQAPASSAPIPSASSAMAALNRMTGIKGPKMNRPTEQKKTSAVQVVDMLLNHGDTLKEAGLLDTVAKSGPAWLKPMLQKLIIRMKYPEAYQLMKQTEHFRKLKANKYKDIAKALLGKNEDLFRRALDVEAKLYGGKGTSDLLRRQVPIVPPGMFY